VSGVRSGVFVTVMVVARPVANREWEAPRTAGAKTAISLFFMVSQRRGNTELIPVSQTLEAHGWEPEKW
jgi:hypothetical protein